MTLALLWFSFFAQAFAGPGTVAVLYFQNQGNPELEPLKVGLSQMLTSDLVGSGGVKVVERVQLQAVLDELKLGHSAVADKDTSAKVGKLLGAEYLVLGSYFSLAGTLRVDARLVRVETGEVVHASGTNGGIAEFMDLERKLATSFRDKLGALIPGPLAALTTLAAVATGAKPFEAAMALSEGLIALDNHELPRARESFQRAIAADARMDAARQQLAALDI